MNNKKLQVWLPLLFALTMITGMFLGFRLRDRSAGGRSFLSGGSSNTIDEVLDLVKNRYVDNVSADSLENIAIEDVLAHLDPHSVYIPAKELQGVNDDMKGSFMGIGVEFQQFNDTVNVMNVIKDGPADKAGLQVGDKALRANDTVVLAGRHLSGDAIKSILRGPEGSPVKLTVLRNGAPKDVVIRRGAIPLPSVDAAYLLEPGTGYIRINKFSQTTYGEFMQGMEKLKKAGMQQLVLDLRGNGGGILQMAVNIADEFLSGDKLIVRTRGSKFEGEEYRAKKEGVFEKGNLVVLVDETSASASEVLSGALQDWDRATIIGRRTFGKGLVQQQYQLSDGGGLRLTVARYYTPLGRNIQKSYSKGKEAYEQELITRFHNGEVVAGDTSKPTGQAYKTPGGRTVYGGGGITPDVFVPFDTTTQPRAVTDLYIRGTLNRFVYDYYMQNRSLLNQYKSPADLAGRFVPGEKEWRQLENLAAKDSISLSAVPVKAKEDVLKKIPALLAKQVWRNEGYFEVNNLTDPMILAAEAQLKKEAPAK
jgi:carboxyl-terminal processing protease